MKQIVVLETRGDDLFNVYASDDVVVIKNDKNDHMNGAQVYDTEPLTKDQLSDFEQYQGYNADNFVINDFSNGTLRINIAQMLECLPEAQMQELGKINAFRSGTWRELRDLLKHQFATENYNSTLYEIRQEIIKLREDGDLVRELIQGLLLDIKTKQTQYRQAVSNEQKIRDAWKHEHPKSYENWVFARGSFPTVEPESIDPYALEREIMDRINHLFPTQEEN